MWWFFEIQRFNGEKKQAIIKISPKWHAGRRRHKKIKSNRSIKESNSWVNETIRRKEKETRITIIISIKESIGIIFKRVTREKINLANGN